MNDEFFDDEQELMEAQVAAASTDADIAADSAAEPESEAAAAAAAAAAVALEQGRAPRRDAPPFWMVLAIAAISLVLGAVIGYLVGTTATISKLEREGAQAARAQAAAGDGASATLPDGHPDLAISEDGTATLAGSDSSES